MPGGHDEELALIFREMRKASQMTPLQLAGHLGTDEGVISALEEGSLRMLPAWPETSRVVTAYAQMLQLDARPILRRIHAQLTSRAPAAATAVKAPPPPTVPPQGAPRPAPTAQQRVPARASAPQNTPRNGNPGATATAGFGPALDSGERPPAAQSAKRRRSIGRRLLNWAALLFILAGIGGGLAYLAQNPKRFYSVLDRLPDPLPRLVRAALELMKPARAPVGSPREQDGKTDRLGPNRPR